jgi:hypothetical protein
MNKNVNTIELATRLAQDILGELVETNKFTYDDFYVETDDNIVIYTELGQKKFDEYYDFYLSLIDDCEVKYSDDYTALNGEIKHYCVDVDIIIDGEIIPKNYTFNSSKDAKVLYDKLKAEGKVNNYKIDSIKLIRVFNNGFFEIFNGELILSDFNYLKDEQI